MTKNEKYYIDSSVGHYEYIFPIARYTNDNVITSNVATIRESLIGNIWFKRAGKAQKLLMMERVLKLINVVDTIIIIIKSREPSLIVDHISIGGSYFYAEKDERVNDIDFNVIVKGNYFDYYDFFDLETIQDSLTNPITKLSFIILGSENLFDGKRINDIVIGDSFIHTDVTIREGLVLGLRNACIFGRWVSPRILSRENLLRRVERQLYQAKLWLTNEIGLNRDIDSRMRKAIRRISEASFLLCEAFPEYDLGQTLSLSSEAIIAYRTNGDIDKLLGSIHEIVQNCWGYLICNRSGGHLT